MCTPALGLSAGTLGSISTGMQVAGLATGVFGSYDKSKANQAAYEYQSSVNKNNATMAGWQAQDALQRGATAEQNQRLKTAQLRSSQRARLAANGVIIDEGSALNLLDDTDFMGERDALTIRDNAKREAWGARVQASNYSNDAAMLSNRADAESPLGSAASTLLTGAGTVADSWYRRSVSTSGPKRNAYSGADW